MNRIVSNVVLVSAALAAGAGAFAQQPMSPEEQEKQLYESIQSAVDRYEATLDLEDWQIFYVDSILTANAHGMRDELMALNEAKVSNSDLYQMAQDKWMERSYQAFRKVLDDKQWSKFLKGGAANEKKARDRREQKARKAAEQNNK